MSKLFLKSVKRVDAANNLMDLPGSSKLTIFFISFVLMNLSVALFVEALAECVFVGDQWSIVDSFFTFQYCFSSLANLGVIRAGGLVKNSGKLSGCFFL